MHFFTVVATLSIGLLLLLPRAALDRNELDAPVGPAPPRTRRRRARNRRQSRRKRNDKGCQLRSADAVRVDPSGPPLQLQPLPGVVAEENVLSLPAERGPGSRPGLPFADRGRGLVAEDLSSLPPPPRPPRPPLDSSSSSSGAAAAAAAATAASPLVELVEIEAAASPLLPPFV